MFRKISILLALWCSLTATKSFADQPQLIVSRDSQSVELYFALPTREALALLDMPPAVFANEQGLVDFDAFRNGTVEIATELWQGVQAQVGQQPVMFEPMSLMLHPKEDRIPFETPWDGLTSVSVCSTEGGTAQLEETTLYLAMIAYTDQADGPVQLSLPTARGAQFDLRDFREAQMVSAGQVRPNAAQVLVIPAVPGWGVAELSVVALVLLGLAGLAARVVMRRQPG